MNIGPFAILRILSNWLIYLKKIIYFNQAQRKADGIAVVILLKYKYI